MKKITFAALLLAGGFCFAHPAGAQEKTVELTTQSAVGTTLTLKVNATVKGITVDWGDGQPVTYETPRNEGISTIKGTVKGPHITLTGDSSWDMLSCAHCNLTDINLEKATDLRSLYCQHNNLTTLSVKGLTQLVDLDCSYNQLQQLVFSEADGKKAARDLAAIENLNLSHNQFTGMYYLVLPTLQHVDVSGNQYQSFYIYDESVRSINCSDNQLKGTLNLTRCPNTQQLLCFGNRYARLTLSESGKQVRQLLCDQNEIEEIDLSQAEDLKDFSCSNNQLSLVSMHKNADLYTLNVANNALNFGVLPQKRNAPAYLAFEPQRPFPMEGIDGIQMKDGICYVPVSASWANKTSLDLKPICSLSNGRPDAIYACYSIDAEGNATALVQRKSSSDEGDFYANAGKFSFFHAVPKAVVHLTSKTYGFSIQSEPFAVGDEVTGLEELPQSDAALQVIPGKGEISFSGKGNVSIITLDGKTVWHGFVEGTTTLPLHGGIYLVNGKKVIL